MKKIFVTSKFYMFVHDIMFIQWHHWPFVMHFTCKLSFWHS